VGVEWIEKTHVFLRDLDSLGSEFQTSVWLALNVLLC